MALKSPNNYGFSLIELLVTLSVLGIAISIALPSFTSISQKQALINASEQFVSDLQLARSASIKQNKDVYISVTPTNGSTSWCYGATEQATGCNCNSGDACTIDTSTVIARNNRNISNVNVAFSNFTSNILTLKPRGIIDATNAQVTFSVDGKSIVAKINPLGRVTLCSNSYSNYAAC